MANLREDLWPYSKTAAILTVPIVWILFAIIFALTQKYANWPDAESRHIVMIAVVIISFIPLVFVLLDFVSSRRAVFDIKGIKIDFSQIDFSQSDVIRESFGLPDNIGVPGAIISDSSPMQIILALKKATANEIVIVDIKDGNAWWVTRLFALCAGAVRAGLPKAFLFLGVKENIPGTFLGWAEPKEIQKSILNAKEEYRSTYQAAMRIVKQIAMFGANELLPQSPAGFSLHFEVTRYTNVPEFVKLGEAAFEQILMDQLVKSQDPATFPPKTLENPPDRLTLGRLTELFGHCLYHDAIDLTWSNEKQISHFLDSYAPYVALLRNGKYQSMLKREDGERLIIKKLLTQAPKNK